MSALEGRALNALRAASLPELAVGPLSEDSRRSIVCKLLRSEKREQLSDEKVKTLYVRVCTSRGPLE